jgi:peptide/nickel transport system substrate-binding protein
MNRQIKLVALLLLAGLMLATCGPTPQPQVVKETVVVTERETVEVTQIVKEEVPVEVTTIVEKEVTAVPQAEPVTMRIRYYREPSSLNPLQTWGGGWHIKYMMYDRLSDLDTVTSVRPGLAESWEYNEDYTVWTFKIREGVTFHDGTPCAAEDIAWSINWMIENEFPSMSAYVDGIKEAIALDGTTLQLNLEGPSPNLVSAKLIFLWILPRSVWEGLTYDEVMEKEGLDCTIGTGPYKVVDWMRDQYMILEAYDGYWRGRSPVDRIIFQHYSTEEAAVQALLAGEIDMIDQVPWHAVETLEEVEDIEVVTLPILWTQYLMLNAREQGTQARSLLDPTVRLAIAHAIDKQRIIDIVYLGYGEVGTIPTDSDFGDLHNPNIVDVPFDIAEGNRILDEAGYIDTDGDGIREWSDGTSLQYRMYTDEGATGIRKLEIVAEGLAQVGISATPQQIDKMGSLYPDYDFDLATWGWRWDPDIDESLRSFRCEEAPDGWNDCGLCDPQYDELYAQLGATLDEEKRRDIIWQMQEIFFESRCYIVFSYPPQIAAYRSDRFTNFNTTDYSTLWYPKSIFQVQTLR